MNRVSVSKIQKPKNAAFLSTVNFLQRKKFNQSGYEAALVDTQDHSEQRLDGPGLSSANPHSNYDFSKIPIALNSPSTIQTKLKIGQPDDKYEQEADRVAEQIMSMPEPRLSSSVGGSSPANTATLSDGKIQRSCTSCSEEFKTAEDEKRPVESAKLCPKCRTQEGLIQTKQITQLIQRQEDLKEEEDEEIIQTKTTGGITPEVTPPISSSIQTLQGGGRPLSGKERNFFEPHFGADFSNVRIHNDSMASSLARSVNARAFTIGHNIVFGARQYKSDALTGRKLLAHELTHVMQQNSNNQSVIQRETPAVSNSRSEDEVMNEEERQRLVEALCIGRQAGEGPTRCEFTSRQLRRVEFAQSRARYLAARAGLALHSTDRYIRTMARRFFDLDNLDVQAMLNILDRIRDNVDDAPILCGTCSDEVCNSAPAAYVPDDFSAIVICPFFFTLSQGQMIRTLLHEAGHYVKIDDAPDYEHPRNCIESDSVECGDPCSGISDRLRNVDVWARFIECAAYSY